MARGRSGAAPVSAPARHASIRDGLPSPSRGRSDAAPVSAPNPPAVSYYAVLLRCARPSGGLRRSSRRGRALLPRPTLVVGRDPCEACAQEEETKRGTEVVCNGSPPQLERHCRQAAPLRSARPPSGQRTSSRRGRARLKRPASSDRPAPRDNTVDTPMCRRLDGFEAADAEVLGGGAFSRGCRRKEALW